MSEKRLDVYANAYSNDHVTTTVIIRKISQRRGLTQYVNAYILMILSPPWSSSSPSLLLRGDDGLQPPELDRGDPDLHQRHPRRHRLPEVHLRRSPWNLRKALNKDFTILLIRAGSQC